TQHERRLTEYFAGDRIPLYCSTFVRAFLPQSADSGIGQAEMAALTDSLHLWEAAGALLAAGTVRE
ncbi:MAG: hypothetical protein NZ789_13410, partial [Pseudomonadales bacterium]|nr:hypothetical protein [Pseudomonadales bacterium]